MFVVGPLRYSVPRDQGHENHSNAHLNAPLLLNMLLDSMVLLIVIFYNCNFTQRRTAQPSGKTKCLMDLIASGRIL